MQHASLLKLKWPVATPKRGVAISKASSLNFSFNQNHSGVGTLARHPRSPQKWLPNDSINSKFAVSALPDDTSSSNEDPIPANDPNTPPPAYDPTSYTKGHATVAIPVGLRSAGAVFILAGFLKILILCFPFSSMAISMFVQGKADLGTWAALKMIPFALGILSLAKVLVDRKIHERKWFHRSIVAASVVALIISRWLFARSRPSPLDPLIAAHQREVVAAVAEARKQQAANAMAQQQGRYLEPSQQAKQDVAQRPRSRFS